MNATPVNRAPAAGKGQRQDIDWQTSRATIFCHAPLWGWLLLLRDPQLRPSLVCAYAMHQLGRPPLLTALNDITRVPDSSAPPFSLFPTTTTTPSYSVTAGSTCQTDTWTVAVVTVLLIQLLAKQQVIFFRSVAIATDRWFFGLCFAFSWISAVTMG